MNGESHIENVQWLPVDKHIGTLSIHSDYKATDASFNAVTEPISMSVTFGLDAPFKIRDTGYAYTRTGNPTRNILEKRLAAIEGGDYGLCYASGCCAMLSVMDLLRSGDHLICSDGVYGGTVSVLTNCGEGRKIQTDFIDMCDIEMFRSALNVNTKMVILETPGNPTLKVVDIALICEIAHEYCKDIIVVVDNTFLTPYFQKALPLGADLVHYSLTKYMNGHMDVLMGAVITSRKDLYEKLKGYQNVVGPVPSPFDCYLVLRGLKTLHIRMPAFMANGIEIAKFLEKHPKVDGVLHPGLPSHPQHELALKQSSGHSGLIAFYIKNGSSTTFLENLKIFQNAGSLGGCESLAEIPFFFTHKDISKELQKQLGITPNLVRLSIGLESSWDLIEDLNQALNNC